MTFDTLLAFQCDVPTVCPQVSPLLHRWERPQDQAVGRGQL